MGELVTPQTFVELVLVLTVGIFSVIGLVVTVIAILIKITS